MLRIVLAVGVALVAALLIYLTLPTGANRSVKLKKLITTTLFNVRVEGIEHLKEIPPGTAIIVTFTHRADTDQDIAIGALAKLDARFNDALLFHLDKNFKLWPNPFGYLFVRLECGLRNVTPYETFGSGTKLRPYTLTQAREDSWPRLGWPHLNSMEDALRKAVAAGRPVFIPAYYKPAYEDWNSTTDDRMIDFSAHALAITEGVDVRAVLVPVSVVYEVPLPQFQIVRQHPELKVRPKTVVRISAPLDREDIIGHVRAGPFERMSEGLQHEQALINEKL